MSAEDLEFRVGQNGNFYFLFHEKGKICRFDSAGKLIRSVLTAGPLTHRHVAFTLTPEGDVLLLDGRGRSLYRYDVSLDLVGKYSLAGKDELEPFFGLTATSWGDLFVAAGLQSKIWKLEPEGQSFTTKPVFLPESFRYSFPFEVEGGKLAATDPLGALMMMDRYGNLLRSFSFRKGLRAAPLGENFLATFWPYTEVMVLNTVGVVLSNWKAAELDSVFKNVMDFQVVQSKVYFLLPSSNTILVFQLKQPKSKSSTEEGNRGLE
ncbi:MAG TPA: hypothetical protein VNL73_03905 [Verrucomicrobiae bacterium]|nr:hypothetical protein [Verrucomicrobiae bacterium]